MLYDLLEPHSENLPEIFVEAIEKRASVQRLYRWGRPENEGRKSCVIAIGNDFIQCFCQKKPIDSPEMVSKFKNLRDSWIAGMTR